MDYVEKKKVGWATATVLFLGFVLVGGVWVSLIQVIPPGLPRKIATCAFGFAFAGLFGWQLIERVREAYSGESFEWTTIIWLAVNLVLMLAAFAFVYAKLGIVDTTRPDSPMIGGSQTTLDWATYGRCLYFSVITLTTVGYGDFQPSAGLCRIMASTQGLLGYLVLGILASTSTTLIERTARDEE